MNSPSDRKFIKQSNQHLVKQRQTDIQKYQIPKLYIYPTDSTHRNLIRCKSQYTKKTFIDQYSKSKEQIPGPGYYNFPEYKIICCKLHKDPKKPNFIQNKVKGQKMQIKQIERKKKQILKIKKGKKISYAQRTNFIDELIVRSIDIPPVGLYNISYPKNNHHQQSSYFKKSSSKQTQIKHKKSSSNLNSYNLQSNEYHSKEYKYKFNKIMIKQSRFQKQVTSKVGPGKYLKITDWNHPEKENFISKGRLKSIYN